MAKVKSLNDTKIRAIKSTGKAGGDWLADGEGLYLVVFPTGAKVWKLRYMTPFTKKKNTYTIGGYPEISLQEARQIKDDCRALLS